MVKDWLYDEGEDASRGVYVSKMDEIRFVAGPIVGRYMDKIEEDRQAALKIEEEKAAKKKAEQEAKRKAEEEAKKAAESKKSEGANGTGTEDAEMTDAEALHKPDGVEEPAEEAKK